MTEHEILEALFPHGFDTSGLPQGSAAATAVGLLDVDGLRQVAKAAYQ